MGMPTSQPPHRFKMRPPKTMTGQRYPHKKASTIIKDYNTTTKDVKVAPIADVRAVVRNFSRNYFLMRSKFL